MALPKRIEEQGRRAEELQKQQIDLQQGVTAPPETAPVVEKKPEPAAEPPAEPAKPAILDGPESKEWEQRYRVLQGKYNSEVPRLQSENRQLRTDVQSLRDEMEQVRDQVRNQPTPAPVLSANIKPEELEQYGPEFVEFVKRIATSVAPAPQVVDMSAVEERIRPVEEATVRSLKNSFFGDLVQLAPRWEQLNTDTEFLGWLSERDPLSGKSRQELFNEAYSRLDAQRVAAFFNGFGGSDVGVASAATPAESMVTPSTLRSQPPVPAGKRIWRSVEIANFYNAVRQGRYAPEEAAKIEQEIFAAQSENRVR